MWRLTGWMTGMVVLALTAGACLAEEPPHEPGKFYKLEFVVKEVSGSKIVNSRSYSTMVMTGRLGEIRAGSKIPFAARNEQIEQIDVGVNIDVQSLKEGSDRLFFNIVAEVSSVADGGKDLMRPTIRQNRWNSVVVIPLRKATVLFSSDNLDAKTQIQIEVTAVAME